MALHSFPSFVTFSNIFSFMTTLCFYIPPVLNSSSLILVIYPPNVICIFLCVMSSFFVLPIRLRTSSFVAFSDHDIFNISYFFFSAFWYECMYRYDCHIKGLIFQFHLMNPVWELLVPQNVRSHVFALLPFSFLLLSHADDCTVNMAGVILWYIVPHILHLLMQIRNCYEWASWKSSVIPSYLLHIQWWKDLTIPLARGVVKYLAEHIE